MSEELDRLVESVSWDEEGLVPAIAQSSDGDVLTLAYMDREALQLTLSTGYGHYYSRSKGRIRKKGEVSGNVQRVRGSQELTATGTRSYWSSTRKDPPVIRESTAVFTAS